MLRCPSFMFKAILKPWAECWEGLDSWRKPCILHTELIWRVQWKTKAEVQLCQIQRGKQDVIWQSQMTVTGPSISVFLISKISMTGNPGTIAGKSQTCDFPFPPIALPLPRHAGWPMRMVASHSLNQSYWRKCSALHRCLKVHLPPSQHSRYTLWGQERFILFICSSDKEATSSEYRGQRNSLALLSFLLLLKPEPLFISLAPKAGFFQVLDSLLSFNLSLFKESFQKQLNEKSKTVGKRLLFH